MRHHRILIGPAVSDTKTFVELLARLGHYFGHVDVERICVPLTASFSVASAKQTLADPQLPEGYAARLKSAIDGIAGVVDFVDDGPADLQNAALISDLLLLWDKDAVADPTWRDIEQGYRRNRTSFIIDWRKTRADGSWLAEAASILSKRSRRFDDLEERTFRERTAGLHGIESAFLVATGPSARAALDIDMSRGVRIVCNTVVLDDELMDAVSPDIVTFADPIFHFGPSTYAAAFQDALLRQSDRHDFTIVTVERYADLLRARLPSLASRICGVRLGTSQWSQNFDLEHRFAVRPYPNILTMLMLPLATTFSERIHLTGFDGRAPDETYFWRHGSTVQLEQELEEIKQVHPGFFELDYDDYYHEHIAAVELLFTEMELRDHQVVPLTPSFMLPLGRRMSDDTLDWPDSVEDPGLPSGRPIVSITPDWVDDFGHFGPWERVVGNAARSMGHPYYSLTGRAREPENSSEIPIFSRYSYRGHSRPFDAADFEQELRRVLAVGPRSCCYVYYAADVWHLPTLLAVARDHPDCHVAVNVMRAHGAVSSQLGDPNGWSSAIVSLLRSCLVAAQGSNLRICVDSDAIASDIQLLTGVRPHVWPMVMVADPERLSRAAAEAARSRTEEGRPVRVVSVALPQLAKGFDIVAGLPAQMRGEIRSGTVEIAARYVRSPADSSRVQGLARQFSENGGQLIDGTLSDDEYAQCVGRADVVLIPYRLSVFRTRTSGVFLDAIAAGKPVVAVRGTWAGNLIEEHGLGTVFADGQVEDLRAAIERSVRHLDALRGRVREFQAKLVEDYRPERLVEFLDEFANESVGTPSGAAVDQILDHRDLVLSVYMDSERRRSRDETAHAVALDSARREQDDALDTVESLQRAVQWRDANNQRSKGRPPKSSKPTRVQLVAGRDKTAQFEFDRTAHAHVDELALVAEIINPASVRGGVMIDVGAHHGSAFRPFLDAGWTVHAFEPDERHADYLGDRFGNHDRLTLDRRAVASVTADQRTFYISAESTGISGLSAFRESHQAVGSVETVALRDVQGIGRCDLLKIDTEGYEMEVLSGLDWEAQRPSVIVAEFEDSKSVPLGHNALDLIAVLEKRCYEVWVSEWHPIIRYGIQHDWKRIYRADADNPPADSWGNLLAFAEPPAADVIVRALNAVVTVERPPQTTESSSQLRGLRRVTARTMTRAGLPPKRVRAIGRRVKHGLLDLS